MNAKTNLDEDTLSKIQEIKICHFSFVFWRKNAGFQRGLFLSTEREIFLILSLYVCSVMGGNKELIQNPTFGIFEPPYWRRHEIGVHFLRRKSQQHLLKHSTSWVRYHRQRNHTVWENSWSANDKGWEENSYFGFKSGIVLATKPKFENSTICPSTRA